jgi:O-acetyl-ADP-ribose deacetylase (regulator of RNase III)
MPEKDKIDLRTKVFISYKTGPVNSARALNIAEMLGTEFNAFVDQEGLQVAHAWPQTIYDNVVDSDVLIVLLTPEVLKSEWVRREVDLAKGAHISVIPVLVEGSDDEANSVLNYLGFKDVQWLDFKQPKPQNRTELIESIYKGADTTKAGQEKWIKFVNDRSKERYRKEIAANVFSLGAYRYLYNNKISNTEIHIASGDITRLPSIDVIVNSENAYMQMARFYERETVSASIRQSGVYRKGLDYFGDNIQDELDIQVKTRRNGKMPIPLSDVLVTTAGDEKAYLRKTNKTRYIFHVATLQPSTESGLERIKDTGLVTDCVSNCLNQVIEVNDSFGNIFIDAKGNQYANIITGGSQAKEDYEPIRSIIIPILATGTGGLGFDAAVKAILEGVFEFLRRENDVLDRIHIAAYTHKQVEDLKNILEKHDSLRKVTN